MAARQLVSFYEVVLRALSMDRLRARLQDKKLTGDPVFRPLDVHRLIASRETRVMVLDRARPLSKLKNLETRKAKPISLRLDDRSDGRADTVVVEYHLDLFDTQLSRDDRPVALL